MQFGIRNWVFHGVFELMVLSFGVDVFSSFRAFVSSAFVRVEAQLVEAWDLLLLSSSVLQRWASDMLSQVNFFRTYSLLLLSLQYHAHCRAHRTYPGQNQLVQEPNSS